MNQSKIKINIKTAKQRTALYDACNKNDLKWEDVSIHQESQQLEFLFWMVALAAFIGGVGFTLLMEIITPSSLTYKFGVSILYIGVMSAILFILKRG